MADKMRITRLIVFSAGITTLLVLSAIHGRLPRTSAQPPATVTTAVRGYIASAVGGKVDPAVASVRFSSHDVFLPGVKVVLKNASTQATSPPVLTDLSGRFTIPAPEGRYHVCWNAKGFIDGCSHDIYSVSNSMLHVGTVHIPVNQLTGTTIVFGQVSMADNSLPRALEPLANINAFARVELLDSKHNNLNTVYVNNFGEYLLPQVPVRQEIALRAKIEGATADQPIHTEANLAGAPLHHINLQFANHPPRLDPLVASDAAGRRVAAALPGDVVKLATRASDPDGDPLRFTWLVAGGSGNLNSTTASAVDWKLPNREGMYSVTVIAYDGKGGYAQSSLLLRADKQGIPFSGTVNSTVGGVVPGAKVEINSVTATTDAGGFFRVHVKDASQFVLNIRKPGFGLVSRVYDRGITGGLWTLTPATVATVDPTKPISVANERRPSDCPGLPSARLDWKDFPRAALLQWQDGKGNVVAPPAKVNVTPPGRDQKTHYQEAAYSLKGCGPGISVKIPANALQDEHGHAPAGKVQVSLSTVDLMSPDQMPGDYTVKLPNGDTRVMESYGAGGVEITASSHRYNLKPGARAQVTIPVDRAQLAAGGALPPSIPLLFYEEKSGVWLPEGRATRQGNFYVATVKHLSEINTDTIKVNESCVDVLSPALPATYSLEVTIPLALGQAPKVPPPYSIDNSPPSEHALYNLPSNTNIVLVPYDPATNIPYGTFVVNTGGPQNPTKPNRPVGPPFHACATQVVLTPQILPPAPLFGEFLHGLFSFAATNLDELTDADPTQHALKLALGQATTNYYAQIDPRGKRFTGVTGGVCNLASDFSCFKNANGLSDNPLNLAAGEKRVVYANAGDLGFGRDMHCKKQPGTDGLDDVACYVTNYGTILTPDVDDANAAITGTTVGSSSLVATVAMEYSRIESPPGTTTEFDDPQRVVKFFVYGGNGAKLLAASLDLIGARPVPQLCMVCHGGNYPGGANLNVPPFNSRNDVKLGSLFLPFDLHHYTFPTTVTPQIADPSKHGQQANFQTLNQDIVNAANPGSSGQAIHDVISCANPGDCMYPGGTPQDQHEDFVVPAGSNSWQTDAASQTMYKVVVANACRTCHVANPAINLRFTDRSQMIDVVAGRLGSIESRVCAQHVMPHSKRTHDLFWRSLNPHEPGELQVFGDSIHSNGWQGNLCGVFTAGGATPPSLFTPVQAVFTTSGGCTGCHIGSSAPPANLGLAPLDLTAGNAYADLVDVNSSELPTMKRISSTDHDPNNSYLFNKVNGTHGGLAGCPSIRPCFGGPGSETPCGGRMPCGGTLSQIDISKIQTWISAGAPP